MTGEELAFEGSEEARGLGVMGWTPPDPRPGWANRGREKSHADARNALELPEFVEQDEDVEAFSVLIELEQPTNPRVQDEVGTIRLVPPERRISGPTPPG